MQYSTVFPATESPISEGGFWLGGAVVGLDWSNINTTPGKAVGTQNGTATGNARFADSMAIRTGTWGPNQTSIGVVFNNLGAGGDWAAEVEFFLRFYVGAHEAFGYEINFACNPGRLGGGANDYCTIVRWNGVIGDFTTLQTQHPGAVHQGDVLTAQINGNTLTGFINGSSVITATDSMFASGNPGFGGFFSNGTQTGDPTQWGWSAMSLSDGNNPIVARSRFIN